MLNDKQQEAFNGITELFGEKTPQVAILTGSPGTGKTYLTRMLAEALNPKLCAMTHKACEVMNVATGRNVVTFAKIMKQQKIDNLNTGAREFRSADDIDVEASILFIDEASIMSEHNYQDVMSKVAPKTHILFIGDKFQLPPVNELKAIALHADVKIFTLTEPHRFDKNSGINALADSIKMALVHDATDIKDVGHILKTFEDVEWITAAEAGPRMIQDFKDATDVNDVRMISFTNAQVETYNYHLKQAVTSEVERLVAGDLLVANESIIGMNKEIIIRNNQVIKAVEVVTTTVDGFDCYAVTFGKNVLNVPFSIAAMVAREEQLRNIAMKFPNKSDERRGAFRAMFKFRDQFCDMRPSYAQTIHKSQGSTYQTVYLDMYGLRTDTKLGRHLLYTAATRAAKKLIIFK